MPLTTGRRATGLPSSTDRSSDLGLGSEVDELDWFPRELDYCKVSHKSRKGSQRKVFVDGQMARCHGSRSCTALLFGTLMLLFPQACKPALCLSVLAACIRCSIQVWTHSLSKVLGQCTGVPRAQRLCQRCNLHTLRRRDGSLMRCTLCLNALPCSVCAGFFTPSCSVLLKTTCSCSHGGAQHHNYLNALMPSLILLVIKSTSSPSSLAAGWMSSTQSHDQIRNDRLFGGRQKGIIISR